MKYFKITKYFKGGSTIYYAKMLNHQRMRRGCWDSQLQDWGESTNGGHNYGWRIYAKPVKKCPLGTKERWLKFNTHYLIGNKSLSNSQ